MRAAKKAAATRTITAAPVGPPLAHSGGAEYLSVKGTLHQQLLDELDRRNLLAASEETLTEFVQTFVDEALRVEDLPLNEDERRRLVGDLLEETLGVGPLASLMADPAVTDILVNRPEQVYVERFGRLEKTDVRFRDVDHLVRIIQRIAARVGRRIDESSPMVNARLPDGSRVNATLPPVTLDSPTLSIRRFGRQRLAAQRPDATGHVFRGHPRFSRGRGAGPQEHASFPGAPARASRPCWGPWPRPFPIASGS